MLSDVVEGLGPELGVVVDVLLVVDVVGWAVVGVAKGDDEVEAAKAELGRFGLIV